MFYKKWLLFLCGNIFMLHADQQSLYEQDDPLLVIVLMVKNEQLVIRETLQPYIDAGIQSFFIFDTGSTDNTITVVKEYFASYNIKDGCIGQEPFVDFATSRNRALTLAQQAFPRAQFMLMPDAEWYMHQVKDLITFCHQEKNTVCPCYLIRIGNNNFEFYTSRLIRCSSQAHFVGDIHEALQPTTRHKVPAHIYFECGYSPAGYEKSAQRWTRDRDILLKRYQRNPHDPRTAFYLAQTYACLGDWEHAYTYYKERTKLKGWDEENYVALFKCAETIEHLHDMKDPDAWAEALTYYLRAYTLRPQRAEPLIKIAQHYLDQNNMHLAFCFARQACETEYPHNDILHIEKALYDYTRYDILGRCAWYVGQFEIGEEALRMALTHYPDISHLQQNLKLYEHLRQVRERISSSLKSAGT